MKTIYICMFTKKQGLVRNIKFLVYDVSSVRIWKPKSVKLSEFRDSSNYIVRYLIDEGFLKSKKCKVQIMK